MGRRGPREADESRPELKVGDEVLVYVLQPESPEGHAVLSLRRAGLERKWRAMQERFDAGEIVEARVIDHNKGGLIVDLGVRGFVPISQIVDFPRRPRDEQPRDAAQEIAEKLQPFVGRTLRLKILEVNRKANRLILSEKVALYEERREKRDELFSSLQVGQRVTGVVRSIAPFGVFIDLGGIDGLVHKSELSWNKVNNPETAYEIGEEVEAEVIDINHERGRISLSIRRLQPDPWQESVAKYQIGDLIEGTVTKLVNFGAFVRVEEGLEGLIHISELSNQRVAHPGDVVKEGEVLKLKIISLDSERHRLGLSLKQAEDRPGRRSDAGSGGPCRALRGSTPAPGPRPRPPRPRLPPGGRHQRAGRGDRQQHGRRLRVVGPARPVPVRAGGGGGAEAEAVACQGSRRGASRRGGSHPRSRWRSRSTPEPKPPRRIGGRARRRGGSRGTSSHSRCRRRSRGDPGAGSGSRVRGRAHRGRRRDERVRGRTRVGGPRPRPRRSRRRARRPDPSAPLAGVLLSDRRGGTRRGPVSCLSKWLGSERDS